MTARRLSRQNPPHACRCWPCLRSALAVSGDLAHPIRRKQCLMNVNHSRRGLDFFVFSPLQPSPCLGMMLQSHSVGLFANQTSFGKEPLMPVKAIPEGYATITPSVVV